MAVNRYDQRKNYEEQEANAISTEYVRAEFLPQIEAAKLRSLLRGYLDKRIQQYATRKYWVDTQQHRSRYLAEEISQLQNALWSTVVDSTGPEHNAISALVVNGMNDVLNSQGYSEAAWLNRVPITAWMLLIAVAIFCNLLVGYRANGRGGVLFWILPFAIAICFFLIADIDSPLSGVIRVHAQNLEILAESIGTP